MSGFLDKAEAKALDRPVPMESMTDAGPRFKSSNPSGLELPCPRPASYLSDACVHFAWNKTKASQQLDLSLTGDRRGLIDDFSISSDQPI